MNSRVLGNDAQIRALQDRIAELEKGLAVVTGNAGAPAGCCAPGPGNYEVQKTSQQGWQAFNGSKASSIDYHSDVERGIRPTYQPTAYSDHPTGNLEREVVEGFSREESRPPLPSTTIDRRQIVSSQDMVFTHIHLFFRDVCPLYPVICDKVTAETTAMVVARGFPSDLATALVLMAVALSKEYSAGEKGDDGMSEFSFASMTFQSLPAQFTLECVQFQILAALFVLHKGRALDCWQRLHRGCTDLYVMLCRYSDSGITSMSLANTYRDILIGDTRRQDERNTIRRLFWICINLERWIYHFPGLSCH